MLDWFKLETDFPPNVNNAKVISIYDGEDFAIEFNHFRSIKGCFDKDSNIEIMENTLNEKENIFYTENNEMIEDVLKQLLEIHKNVYRR